MKRIIFLLFFAIIILLFFYGISLIIKKGSLIGIVFMIISFISGFILYKLKSKLI